METPLIEDALFDVDPRPVPPAPRPAPGSSPMWLAYLFQRDPSQSLRGWVMQAGRADAPLTGWPETPLQRPGLRPPTREQREQALARLGYTLAPGAKWSWVEVDALDRRTVLLAASAAVVPVRAAKAVSA